jgi:hypothetical protein
MSMLVWEGGLVKKNGLKKRIYIKCMMIAELRQRQAIASLCLFFLGRMGLYRSDRRPDGLAVLYSIYHNCIRSTLLIWKVNSLENSDIPKVFLTPHYVDHCCPNAIRGQCRATMSSCHSCTVIWSHCLAIMYGLVSHCCPTLCSNNGITVPTVVKQLPWSCGLPTS